MPFPFLDAVLKEVGSFGDVLATKVSTVGAQAEVIGSKAEAYSGMALAGEATTLEAAGGEVAENSSNTVGNAQENIADLQEHKRLEAEKFEKAHKRHLETLKIIKKMSANSLRNKAKVMLSLFAVSLVTPKVVLRNLWPVFAGLGVHLGLEAAKSFYALEEKKHTRIKHAKHRLGEAPNPDEILHVAASHRKEEPITVDQIIANANRADVAATWEISGAVIGSYDQLPIQEQAETMAIIGVGLTAGVYLVTMGLVQAEDWGTTA